MQSFFKPAKDKQDQRRITAVIPKRNWVQRNPRLFQFTIIASSLLIFFSKPIYDGFIAEQIPAPPGSALRKYRNI